MEAPRGKGSHKLQAEPAQELGGSTSFPGHSTTQGTHLPCSKKCKTASQGRGLRADPFPPRSGQKQETQLPLKTTALKTQNQAPCVWPWSSYLTSLSLNVLIYETGVQHPRQGLSEAQIRVCTDTQSTMLGSAEAENCGSPPAPHC